MSLISGLVGAATGFLEGGPVGAVVGGIAGGVGAGTAAGAAGNAASALGNVALSVNQASYLAANEALQEQQLNFQLAEQQQADSFDNVTSEKSEIMRESNELRNVAMEQRKADDAITKEFIKSIA